MAAKPVVLPDTFTGEASWDEWVCHFENVSDVSGWDCKQFNPTDDITKQFDLITYSSKYNF